LHLPRGHLRSPDPRALRTLQIELETVNCRLGDGGVEEAERREFRSEGVDRGVRDCFVFVDGLLERAGTNLIAELEEPVYLRAVEVVETLRRARCRRASRVG